MLEIKLKTLFSISIIARRVVMKNILKGDFEWDVIRCDRLIGGNEILIIFIRSQGCIGEERISQLCSQMIWFNVVTHLIYVMT